MIRKFAPNFDNTAGLLPLPIQPSSETMATRPDEGENSDGSGFEDGVLTNIWLFGDMTPESKRQLDRFLGTLIAKSVDGTVVDYDQNLLPIVRNATIIRPTPPTNARYNKGMWRDVKYVVNMWPLT